MQKGVSPPPHLSALWCMVKWVILYSRISLYAGQDLPICRARFADMQGRICRYARQDLPICRTRYADMQDRICRYAGQDMPIRRTGLAYVQDRIGYTPCAKIFAFYNLIRKIRVHLCASVPNGRLSSGYRFRLLLS